MVLSAVGAGMLAAARVSAGAPFSWGGLFILWAFTAGLLLASVGLRSVLLCGSPRVWPWSLLAALILGVGTASAYALAGDTIVAWALAAVICLLLLGLETVLTAGLGAWRRWGTRALLAAVAGAIPVAVAEVESRFADEEFFVVLEAAVLAGFWLLLVLFRDLIGRQKPGLPAGGFGRHRWLVVSLGLLLAAGLWGVARSYQRGFYPLDAPAYPGVSPQRPFLCDEDRFPVESSDGAQVLEGLLAGVAANPHKGTPEYGMLALGTRQERWAQEFRRSLLAEAAMGRYTEPAHSVKSAQYLAAMRAYFFLRVQDQFPALFSGQEQALLREWFAAINRRAMTVEWVDGLYALAFSKWPEGPYENQEIGAGLLALLESGDLAAPELSAANRDYLNRNRRGWLLRFRNTDDAFIYQPEWINNAYFQALATGDIAEGNARRSFDWMLLQALPDGGLPWYNHPARPAYAGMAYLGARLLGDPRYLWLAGQALMRAGEQGDLLWAQPGVEEPVRTATRASLPGSCLLYGDSGLPNQVGPLAPDKIVLRDGWSADASYLLLNLRFTGWHRYKATNTVTLIYQAGALAEDVTQGRSFAWLPEGRSLFRDKRIPRENLNGLLVERTGISAVLYALTGVGGPWAQDPPYYAEVIAFEPGAERDWTHTRLSRWRGWQHDRWVYFYHGGGPIVVVDEATGPAGSQAQLVWHLAGGNEGGPRILLRAGENPAELVFVPMSPAARGPVIASEGNDPLRRVVSYAATGGELRAASVFLLGPWVGADVQFDVAAGALRISRGEQSLLVPLPLRQIGGRAALKANAAAWAPVVPCPFGAGVRCDYNVPELRAHGLQSSG